METLKIGLIGAGDVARSAHMPSFAENAKVEVVAVADPDIASARSLAEKYGIAKAVEDYREILDDPSVGAVDICTPHYLHYQMTMDALNEGKHVICEKPIAMNLGEADRMIQAAHELGLWLLVTLNQRFLPIHRKVKEFLNDGRLGKPFLMNAYITGDVMLQMNDAHHWIGTWDRAGGGAFFDTGTHIVDLAHYWFGEPKSVTATLKRLLASPENKADDNAVVTLEYGDNLVANLVVSYTVQNEAWSEKKFIYGTGGTISIISEAAVPMFFVQDRQPQILEVEHKADWWPWSHDRTLRHFVDCILDGAQPIVTEEDARAALKTILAAYRSAREGRRVEIDR
ncbi:MAG TPA: Gfo/Idh/MocA family oxidoreductase [Armatimonadota bacterium]|nr:Gfo/Idh/MocA family oxidoreductase [Armatimonadota bacterium]